MLRLPRAGRDFERAGKRVRTRGPRVVVAEIVHQFLDPHRALGRALVRIKQAPHIRIAGRVHVDRESRERLILHRAERIVGIRIVGFGIGIFAGSSAPPRLLPLRRIGVSVGESAPVSSRPERPWSGWATSAERPNSRNRRSPPLIDLPEHPAARLLIADIRRVILLLVDFLLLACRDAVKSLSPAKSCPPISSPGHSDLHRKTLARLRSNAPASPIGNGDVPEVPLTVGAAEARHPGTNRCSVELSAGWAARLSDCSVTGCFCPEIRTTKLLFHSFGAGRACCLRLSSSPAPARSPAPP